MDLLEKRDPCRVLIATLEHPKNLCYIEASINPHEPKDSSVKSSFHCRILKCRQLIFTDPQVMASPVLGTENLLHIVTDATYFKNGSIKELFSKLNLSIKEPMPITNRVYESCLHYTIIARVAPQWNQVGNYLVQGRDFLSSNKPLPAVKLDICVNEDIFIVLWPLKIHLQQTNIDDLNISSKISQDFRSQNLPIISELNIGLQWIHVLPFLKKGRVMSISHQIPDTCPFKSYKELKRHWKNMYGYRLPEDNNIIYFNVFFNNINPTVYTYPSICTKMSAITMLHHLNETEILRRFHDDLMHKFPTVCGNPLFINKHLVYAVPKLYKSSMDPSSSFPPHCNLKLSDLIEIKPIISPSPHLLEEVGNLSSAQDNLFSNHITQAISACSSNISLMTPGSSLSLQPTAEVSFVPHSISKSPKISYIDSSHPSFPLQRDQNWGRNEVETKNLGLKKFGPSENVHRDLQFIQRVVQVDPNLVLTPNKTQYNRSPISALKSNVPNSSKSNTEAIEISSSSSEQVTTNLYNPDANDVGSSGFSSNQTVVMDKSRVFPHPSTVLKKGNSSENNLSENMSFNEPCKSADKENNLKRETIFLGHHELTPIAKKPRARPQVQPNVDVELLARNNDFGRVNTATLVYWLRNKLVPCKVKDKKSELVNKVKQYLNLPLENSQ